MHRLFISERARQRARNCGICLLTNAIKARELINRSRLFLLSTQRPPSSSLSYSGPGNDDTRSPGSVGGTPGPLTAPQLTQQSVDNDPGNVHVSFHILVR